MASARLTLAGALALLLGSSALVACAREKADPATRTIEDVLTELAVAGLATAGAAPVDGAALGGGECRKGVVAGLDVTLCGYRDEAAARAAQPAGLASVGEATGAALHHGRLLLVVVDPARADPSGKKINQITRIFLQKT
jgi:hypothetical protein